MNSVNDIRSVFLDYFKSNGHQLVASGSLVPQNDPTLMFTNAGMVPFKNVFTGVEQRPYSRAVTSQKCVRAGGKHNDLDNVGYTARHHTFFEMLGNFSFGDYFKEQAILHAWTLITKEYGLSEDRLLVTVYSEDDEAADLWKKIAGLDDQRIIRIPTSDNFWSMGDTGPCGPCSEIFYDHGEDIWGGPPGSADEDGDRFIEIWNLVFMQYEQIGKAHRETLPRPSIDTGMGLERIAAVLQGKHNNYEIDLFQKLIAASVEATGVKAEGHYLPSHRVIADHLRACSFLVADGVLPSNEGRGYVLRRIMRRAMRHANLLGVRNPLMYRLVPALISQMGDAFPELRHSEDLIKETFEIEEFRFQRTLGRGLQLLNNATKDMAAGDRLEGDVAFKLYDTYGFPLDLTQDALRARSIDVDVDEFNIAMARQKAEARASWSGSGDVASEAIWFSIYEKYGSTEFLGYENLIAEAFVQSIVLDGVEVEEAPDEAIVDLVFNQTPFYAEMGGQVGDCGQILFENGVVALVTSVSKKVNGLFVHHGRLTNGKIKRGDVARLEVNSEKRGDICRNHSATHLLHESLRKVLGEHVMQKGSLVSADRLRFDFSHQKPVSDKELQFVEGIVNEIVQQSHPVTTRLMAVDDAIKAGALALFGEKYGDEVRVVSMGRKVEGSEIDGQFSVELCGGTHVTNTGEIGIVTVVNEGAVSAGIRRIEALTGDAARNYFHVQEMNLKATAAMLKVMVDDVPSRVLQLMTERRQLEKDLSDTKRQLAMVKGAKGEKGDQVEEINGTKFWGKVVEGMSGRELKALADDGKKSLKSGVVVFIGIDEGKAGVVVGVTNDLSERYNAIDLVRAAADVLGGKGGGGRPDMAQAGGPDINNADRALSTVRALI